MKNSRTSPLYSAIEHRAIVAALAIAMVALGSTGCSSWTKSKQSWPWDTSKPAELPSKVVAMWADTVLYQPNQTPRRGFGGRLMFYKEGEDSPVKVNGSLVIYAFDETDRDPDNVKPDRKYVFTKEQLAELHSKSNLGDSYSVWLPWDEVGNEMKEVSLIVRFLPNDGAMLVGEQTKHVLPGPSKQMLAAEKKGQTTTVSGGPATPAPGDGDQVRAVAHVATLEPGKDAPVGRLNTTTIALPTRSARTGWQQGMPTSNATAQQFPAQQLPVQQLAAGQLAVEPATGQPAAGQLPAQQVPGQQLSVAGGEEFPSLSAGLQFPTQAGPSNSAAPAGPPLRHQRTPLTRSALSRPRALGAPIAQPDRDRAGWRQYPSAPQIHPTPEQLVPASMSAGQSLR
jgi:hypothetical protein